MKEITTLEQLEKFIGKSNIIPRSDFLKSTDMNMRFIEVKTFKTLRKVQDNLHLIKDSKYSITSKQGVISVHENTSHYRVIRTLEFWLDGHLTWVRHLVKWKHKQKDYYIPRKTNETNS